MKILLKIQVLDEKNLINKKKLNLQEGKDFMRDIIFEENVKSGYFQANKRVNLCLNLRASTLLDNIIAKYEFFKGKNKLNKKREFFLPVKQMELETGLSEYLQRKNIKKLEKKGLLHTTQKNGNQRYFKLYENRIKGFYKILNYIKEIITNNGSIAINQELLKKYNLDNDILPKIFKQDKVTDQKIRAGCLKDLSITRTNNNKKYNKNLYKKPKNLNSAIKYRYTYFVTINMMKVLKDYANKLENNFDNKILNSNNKANKKNDDVVDDSKEDTLNKNDNTSLIDDLNMNKKANRDSYIKLYQYIFNRKPDLYSFGGITKKNIRDIKNKYLKEIFKEYKKVNDTKDEYEKYSDYAIYEEIRSRFIPAIKQGLYKKAKEKFIA